MAAVSVRNVEKRFGDVSVMRGIDLDIADGEFAVLVGASGCGKSTLLRMIAGLESITAGDIVIGGRRVNDLEPRERDIAMVFQSYALYPHLDVRDNMSFSLKLRSKPRPRSRRRSTQTAGVLNLAHLLERFPRQLSGGQRQRVAMGRAIVRASEGLPVRRAAVQPRRAAAHRDAHRDPRAAPAPRRDLDLRDARPGRSDDDGRPHGRDECRPHRADRRAARRLRRPANAVRGAIHRRALDQRRRGLVDGALHRPREDAGAAA